MVGECPDVHKAQESSLVNLPSAASLLPLLYSIHLRTCKSDLGNTRSFAIEVPLFGLAPKKFPHWEVLSTTSGSVDLREICSVLACFSLRGTDDHEFIF